jgi:hypothetical protein
VKICQPANGCHVNGDLCRKNSDCCGAAGTGLPGDGHVTCEIEPGKTLGICRNPMACNPEGDVCHYMAYSCGNSSARADCCGGLGAKGGVCKLDRLGVPRCYGVGACRQAGETCAFTGDCCNDTPCVPDASGTLHCAATTCVAEGGGCTISADCCRGSTCIVPTGSTKGTCGVISPPPGPGTGGSGGAGAGGTGGASGSGGAGAGGYGGTDDGGQTSGDAGTGNQDATIDLPPPPPPVCSEYGQTCGTGADCCNAVPCTNGFCVYPIQ